MQHGADLIPEDYRFLLAGGPGLGSPGPNPAPEWLSDKTWAEIFDLEKLDYFEGFAKHFAENIDVSFYNYNNIQMSLIRKRHTRHILMTPMHIG